MYVPVLLLLCNFFKKCSSPFIALRKLRCTVVYYSMCSALHLGTAFTFVSLKWLKFDIFTVYQNTELNALLYSVISQNVTHILQCSEWQQIDIYFFGQVLVHYKLLDCLVFFSQFESARPLTYKHSFKCLKVVVRSCFCCQQILSHAQGNGPDHGPTFLPSGCTVCTHLRPFAVQGNIC